MKALTLHQPWAALVALGQKNIETRSWKTNYRGLLAIHAGKFISDENQRVARREPFFSALAPLYQDWRIPRFEFLFGCILCVCKLTDCFVMTEDWITSIPEPERSFGDYEPGRYAWILKNIEILETPIQSRGYPGLWDWTK